MKSTFRTTILLFAMFVTSCGTAVEYRKAMLLKNGAMVPVILSRKVGQSTLEGDTILLKRVGENKWSHNYSTYEDTTRVDRGRKYGYKVKYARAVLKD